jgi:hypothetical protein
MSKAKPDAALRACKQTYPHNSPQCLGVSFSQVFLMALWFGGVLFMVFTKHAPNAYFIVVSVNACLESDQSLVKLI